MTPAQWFSLAALAAAAGSFALAVWGSIAEEDAPGWRSNSAIGGAAVCAVLLAAAMAAAE